MLLAHEHIRSALTTKYPYDERVSRLSRWKKWLVLWLWFARKYTFTGKMLPRGTDQNSQCNRTELNECYTINNTLSSSTPCDTPVTFLPHNSLSISSLTPHPVYVLAHKPPRNNLPGLRFLKDLPAYMRHAPVRSSDILLPIVLTTSISFYV